MFGTANTPMRYILHSTTHTLTSQKAQSIVLFGDYLFITQRGKHRASNRQLFSGDMNYYLFFLSYPRHTGNFGIGLDISFILDIGTITKLMGSGVRKRRRGRRRRSFRKAVFEHSPFVYNRKSRHASSCAAVLSTDTPPPCFTERCTIINRHRQHLRPFPEKGERPTTRRY